MARCKMSMAIMIGADLTDTDLMAADLRGVNFMKASLRNANLRWVNMSELWPNLVFEHLS